MTRLPIDVSDHAVVRFLEREKGMDIAAIKAEILSPLAREAIHAGATGVVIGRTSLQVSNNGTRYVVTTALERKARYRKIRAGRTG